MNLPKYKTDERTGIKYELIGDYYFIASDAYEPEDNRQIGRWGRMHEDYLKKNKRHILDSMLMSGKLHSYLADIDEQARDMFDMLVEQMKEAEGVTEELKEKNQLEWVKQMNNIQQKVREIVCCEFICYFFLFL